MKRNKPLAEEWRQLRHTLAEIEDDLARSPSIDPTGHLVDLLVLGEDRRFYWHPGVDPIALLRALWKTWRKTPQGGSTIAMQLVRTLTGNYERTFKRKLREIILAVMITNWKGRNAIPRLYLWVAYYGWRMNGIRQAYSRLRLDSLCGSQFDAAKLIARLKYPEPSVGMAKRTAQIEHRARYLMSLRGAKHNCQLISDRKWNRSRSLRHS